MNIGSTPPFWMRSSSSDASSMIVRSAAKLVSNTASKPTCLSAAASRSSITRDALALAVALEQRRRHRRRDLRDHHGVGVGQGRDDVVHLVTLDDGARRADADALAAVDALARR